MEHNFDHGKKLSFVVYLLLVLTFFIHQILELTDALYKEKLQKFNRKKYVWSKIKSFANTMYFKSWTYILETVYVSDEQFIPAPDINKNHLKSSKFSP